MNIFKINSDDNNYSVHLRNICNPPKNLYCLGNIELLREKCISIVGTRQSTNYGNYISKKISKKLSDFGFVIVSGLATRNRYLCTFRSYQ